MIEIKRNDDIVSKRIKTITNKKGYKDQKDFCESFNPPIQESMLSDIFKGKRRTIDNMLLIARKLNCSLDFLYGLTDVYEQDTDLQEIGNKLGLSSDSIKTLIEFKYNPNNPNDDTIDYLLSYENKNVLLLLKLIKNYLSKYDVVEVSDSFSSSQILEQTELFTILDLLKNTKYKSNEYRLFLEEKIEVLENKKRKNKEDELCLKLYKTKYDSILLENDLLSVITNKYKTMKEDKKNG